MVGGDRLGDVLQQHRLAGARRRNDQRALALADRRDDIDHPHRHVLAGRVVDLELQPLVGIERGQVVEMHLVTRLLRILEVDCVAFQQREIAFALFRAANHPFDRVAGAQAEAADLRGRNINVVRPGEIVGVRRAQEAESVLEDFDHPLADDLDFARRQLLEDGEHQLLLAHDRGVLDLVLFGEGKQFGGGFFLQVLEFDFPHWEDPRRVRRGLRRVGRENRGEAGIRFGRRRRDRDDRRADGNAREGEGLRLAGFDESFNG